MKLAVETKLKHIEEAVEISSNPLFQKKHMIALTPKHKMKRCINYIDPVGSTVRYEVMKLCIGQQWLV